MIYNLITALQELLTDAGLWKYAQVFKSPEFRTLCALVLCFFFVAMMGPKVIRWLIKQKIGDNPEFYNADLNRLMKQKSTVPTMGGILISGSIFLATIFFADMTNFYVQLGLICLVWLSMVGAADDWLKLTSARRNPNTRDGLKSWEKLLFQIAIALLMGLFIHYYGSNIQDSRLLSLPFQRTINPETHTLEEGVITLSPWLFTILAIFVITGTSNAVNLTDGLDGLASGIMVIVAGAFIPLAIITGIKDHSHYFLLPHIPGSEELAVMAGAMSGSCLGFLWWNCHPARVFMGDTGSLPLGGLLGYITVVIRQEVLLIVIAGVFVFEALSVIMQVLYFKKTGGSRIFRCAPIHHHFHLGGWTEQQVVVRFWLISVLLAAIGLASIKLR